MLMQELRKKTKLILWIVTIAFLGWILFDLGMDIVGKRVVKPYEQGFIAEIDGTKISYDAYRDILYRILSDSTEKKGELSNWEENNIEKEAWLALLEEVRFKKIAKQRELFLDDSTVFFLLMSYPPPQIYNDTMFRTNDSFDIRKYRQYMLDPSNYAFAVRYENLIRETFPKELMRFDLISSVNISPYEIRESIKKENTKFDFDYIFIPFYEIPDNIFKIEEKEIKNYYEQNIEEFKNKAQVSLSLVFFSKSPSSQDTETVYESARMVKELISGGTSFTDAAKSYAQHKETKEKAGDMGWVKMQTFPQNIISILDTLKIGTVSEPLLFKGKLYLFQVKEKKKDALHLLGIDFLIKTSESTKIEAREKAQKFLRLALKYGFEIAAESLKTEIKETPFFPVDSKFIPFIGPQEKLTEFIKNARVNEISNVIWTPEQFIIAKVKDKKNEEFIPLDERQKERIRYKILNEKKKQYAKKLSENLREKWVKDEDFIPEENFIQKKEERGKSIREPLTPFVQKEKIFGILMGMKPGQISPPIEVQTGIVIIKLINVSYPSDNEINQAFNENLQKFFNYRFQRMWMGWKKELRKEEGVKDYRSFLLY